MVMDGSNASMQGTLRKWTNYFSGWQPRWFVLNNGVLAYYKSQEDVVNGCKGSVKMSVCDVLVHPGDNTRLDLIIPGEAYFYVKATTAQERQQWLVALGSCKASLSSNGIPSGNNEKVVEDLPEDSLKAKKSELRLYCDLLMQQVHSVKSSVSETPSDPNIQQLDEATTLLSATCDTFIKTLDDCMKLAHAHKASPSHSQRSLSSSDAMSTSPLSSRRPSISRAQSAPEPPTNVPRNLLPTMEEQNDLAKH